MRKSKAARLICQVGAVLLAALLLPLGAAAGRQRQQVAIETRFVPVQRSYLDQMGISFEFGAVIASENLPLSGTFGPTPPPQSPSGSQAFIGGDVRLPLPISIFPRGAGPVAVGSPVIGVNFRSFFGDGGTALFDIHPASQPTRGTTTRNWSVTPYVGLPMQIGRTQPNGLALIVTPRIGPTFENIELKLEIDEAGPLHLLQRETTRTGVTGGIDFDVILPTNGGGATPFVGIAGEVTSMPSVPLIGNTPLFSYLFRNDGGVSGAVKARLGIFLTPTLIRPIE